MRDGLMRDKLDGSARSGVEPGGLGETLTTRPLVSRSVMVTGRQTDITLRKDTWDALIDIAAREKISLSAVCTLIDKNKNNAISLTLAIRAFTLSYFRQMAARQS